ncbi:MAG: hypothetical protein KYX62_02805 [Pseudomonadota bacterium]|nr:hypothetical protein [Pseudomonadota bacterium]
MKKWLLLALIAVAGWWWYTPPALEPLQQQGDQLTIGEYRITPLQDNFVLTARILSRQDYRIGREADLSPLDLALGWGPMAEPDIYAQFRIRQANRWYFWRAESLPIPQRQVETHSANMHMVPADRRVAAQLQTLQAHQLIEIQGKLIRADAADGWHWISSLTRDDTGNGACELVLVENVRVLP